MYVEPDIHHFCSFLIVLAYAEADTISKYCLDPAGDWGLMVSLLPPHHI